MSHRVMQNGLQNGYAEKDSEHPTKDLLIIYESEAEQWASYLRFHLVGPIPEAGICCYDIAMVTSRQDDFLQLGGYKCKLLILSRGMLEGLCQLHRFFLARVLRPETRVVILLCGVESLDPLLELVPLRGEKFLQISSEQEPQEYCMAVAEIVNKDFDAGDVGVTLYCKGVVKGKASLQFYTIMGDIAHFLQQAADPVKWMCQAFQVSSLEKLDQTLASSLMHKMPTGGFQGLQCDQFPAGESHSEDIPTLLHFAAQHGLRDLASALLQCPGALQALKIPNRCGYTPIDLAHIHGHIQLYILLKESVDDNDVNTDTGIYELMGRTNNLLLADPIEQHQRYDEHEDVDDENVYSPVGRDNEEYDTILTSSNADVIANRPPAPTPRPESLPTPDDKTPFIAQVFQKKMSQGDAEILYSLPTRQARERESISSTYDTFMPSQPPGLDELIKLQEQVKTGSLSIDDALDRFNDWQRLQRGMDSIQQEKIQQLRASIVNNREDNESVYDKISIVHHTPTASENECRRASQQLETDFYSKPLKGQHSHFFKKADKQ
ncbi:B-cell scaffold protein with ankyrin repeats-like isoform X3 [Xyrauchen texanus]|uniref:B-cell scaffold protein with ankyrin repeats-like isoform X3 n=1 Tax=Xyrauchen texanus TaxID=154827 RepID=UPI00224262EF|nr:B-cell scaffold protein with ankyrin repeats-like isoform X3 [Xyrauchen texanus]